MSVATDASAEASRSGSTGFDTCNRIAVERFLKTVVIADNEAELPRLSEETQPQYEPPVAPATSSRTSPPGNKRSHAFSHGCETATQDVAQLHSTGHDRNDTHKLDLLPVTKAFAEKGIICGTYLPDTKTTDDEIKKTLVGLAKYADAVIFDWQLGSSNTEKHRPTIDAITSIVADDYQDRKRLRLIIIYTGEVNIKAEADKLYVALNTPEKDDLVFDGTGIYPVLKLGCVRIVFCNKENSLTKHANFVASGNLPDLVIEQFSELSRGLLRSYALASVAAIRDDIPRLMAQYSPDLDGVFVAQRAFSSDPDDPTAMMHDIMLSDLATVLRSNDIEEYLGAKASLDWFEQSGLYENNQFKKQGLKFTVGEAKLAIQHGSGHEPVRKKIEKHINSEIDINECFISDLVVSGAIQNASVKMAHMATFLESNHLDIGRTIASPPTLTLGSIIKDSQRDDFSLCIIPRCDSVRLTDPGIHRSRDEKKFVGFPIINLIIQNPDDFSKNQTILFAPADSGSNRPLKLLTKKLAHNIKNIEFIIDETSGMIVAQKGEGEKWFFEDIDGNKWEWIGTLREMVAQNIVAATCNALNRVGMNEYEWLRRHRPF